MTDRVSSVDLERLAKIGVVFVPFMTGTAIAVGVIYDVGWFYGVGPGFYSLFSFSEHAVFSLQAFPVALVYITAIFFGD